MSKEIDARRKRILKALTPPPPPRVKSNLEKAVWAVSYVVVFAGAILWGVLTVLDSRDGPPNYKIPESSTPAETTPRPFVLVTVYGDGKYTGPECEGLRVAGMSNDNPKQVDAAVEYTDHCKQIRILESPR